MIWFWLIASILIFLLTWYAASFGMLWVGMRLLKPFLASRPPWLATLAEWTLAGVITTVTFGGILFLIVDSKDSYLDRRCHGFSSIEECKEYMQIELMINICNNRYEEGLLFSQECCQYMEPPTPTECR